MIVIEAKFEVLVDTISNLTEEKKIEIYDWFVKNEIYKNSDFKISKLFYANFEMAKFGKYSYKYWLCRGWNLNQSKEKAKLHTKKGRISPFSYKFYLNKINPITQTYFTEEEAIFEANKIRPIKKEYWIAKGYSEKEAEEKALNTKNNNNKTGAKNSSNRDEESIKLVSNRCKEFWILRGYSEEEAEEKISEQQKTFSLEICIKKHGETEGIKVWTERQDKWQNTLNNKSNEEKLDINKRKNPYVLKNYIKKYGSNYIEKFKECLKNNNIPIFETKEQLKDYTLNLIKEDEFILYKPVEVFIKQHLSKVYFELLDIKNIKEWVLNFVNFKPANGIFKKNSYWCQYTKCNKLLKSSNEILFYNILIENNIEYEVEKLYTNTQLRCDFYLPKYNVYIEICGYNKRKTVEEYKQHMLYKEKTFGSVLLWHKKDYRPFLENLINGNL